MLPPIFKRDKNDIDVFRNRSLECQDLIQLTVLHPD